MEHRSDIQGQGKADLNLPYRVGLHEAPRTVPFAPKTQEVVSPYVVGTFDIRWDNPADIEANSCVNVEGVNIYRSFDSPYGAYVKLNSTPVGGRWYRDQTQFISIIREDSTLRVNKGLNPSRSWYIKTAFYPLVKPNKGSEDYQDLATIATGDVLVEVDRLGDGNWVPAKVFNVNAEKGTILLVSSKYIDPITKLLVDPVLPDLDSSLVRVTYTYVDQANTLKNNLGRKVYYKITTVGQDKNSGEVLETPLSEVEAKSVNDIEKMDWVWKEAVRRNAYLLDQGGERVKLFIRKWNGLQCSCMSKKFGYTKGVCTICYNTGYIGGYEGPYDIKIAPPDTERSVQLTDGGLHTSYQFATWTGPEPLIQDRDFIVRQNNERLIVSQLNYSNARGAILQQMFNLAHLDTGDVVYKVPITGAEINDPGVWDAYRAEPPSAASPVISKKQDSELTPSGKTVGARTATFENIMY